MKYVSMLRGINVSGQKQIKMNDLKSLYERLGFLNVVTYIQSGNVIFDTQEKDPGALKQVIEQAITRRYHFHAPVELRKPREMAKVIDNSPFGPIDPEKEGTKYLVSFLSSLPKKAQVARLLEYVMAPEELVVKGKEVYLHCPNGYGKSKLSNAFIELKLGVQATTRNWKSVRKLYELSLE